MSSTPPPVPPTDPTKAAPPTGEVARGDAKAPNPPTVPDQTAPDAGGVAVAHVGFMQQQWVQNLLPIATSAVLHIGLFAVGFALLGVAKAVTQLVVEEQVIIPDAVMAENGPPGGIVNPGTGGDSTRRAEQNIDDTVTQSDGWAQNKGAALQASLAGAAGDTTGEAMIGMGAGTIGSKGGKNFGVGAGGDGAGVLAPFGTPGGGGGIGPKAPFAGIGGNARKIVYVCDASGTMLDVFSALRDQLKQSVGTLVPQQFFNVVFFSDENVFVFNKAGLMIANPDNKNKLYDWIDGIAARGGTTPIPAIQAAFANKPELMYVLTDGFDQVADLESIYKEFEKLNPDRKVKVNCILLTTKDKKMEDKDVATLHDLLKRIADKNGGILKVVDRDKF